LKVGNATNSMPALAIPPTRHLVEVQKMEVMVSLVSVTEVDCFLFFSLSFSLPQTPRCSHSLHVLTDLMRARARARTHTHTHTLTKQEKNEELKRQKHRQIEMNVGRVAETKQKTTI
jgi:hypothetical protein